MTGSHYFFFFFTLPCFTHLIRYSLLEHYPHTTRCTVPTPAFRTKTKAKTKGQTKSKIRFKNQKSKLKTQKPKDIIIPPSSQEKEEKLRGTRSEKRDTYIPTYIHTYLESQLPSQLSQITIYYNLPKPKKKKKKNIPQILLLLLLPIYTFSSQSKPPPIKVFINISKSTWKVTQKISLQILHST